MGRAGNSMVLRSLGMGGSGCRIPEYSQEEQEEKEMGNA